MINNARTEGSRDNIINNLRDVDQRADRAIVTNIAPLKLHTKIMFDVAVILHISSRGTLTTATGIEDSQDFTLVSAL